MCATLLTRVADGSLPINGALDSLAAEPIESLGFATIDHHRALRQGFPEVIYVRGKTPSKWSASRAASRSAVMES